VAHKTGEIGFTRNDAGIVYEGDQHIIVVLFALRQNNDVTEQDMYDRMGGISRAVYDYCQFRG
jgi:hypothetical protein